ncbi:hypothetical protein SERLADRAFT_439766 [Serpula lacrymans var. lacrymans S7.9]|uniref:Uncharacterized protein n=1 Tax=Serpula lacrymans var. lacrymans (strain S7.9) TaxID=578457 RepID=F8P1H4_SERL9|nr:uncharacterized protein SERLADRAFT_439766 [Serpula lacrymans var. lacrymans S7.9]EGO23003.1 hypothetical protein SERLADRAFT_439766 [Serpula lacrymans var. lacrymans S7.9]
MVASEFTGTCDQKALVTGAQTWKRLGIAYLPKSRPIGFSTHPSIVRHIGAKRRQIGESMHILGFGDDLTERHANYEYAGESAHQEKV